MNAFLRPACALCAALGLAACAPMLSLVGTNQTMVQVVAQVERVKVAGDGVAFVGSGKTVTDHALSAVTGADCKIFNIMSGKPVCVSTPAAAPADAKVRVSAAPAADSYPQPAARMPHEVDAANSAPAPDHSAGDE